MLFVLAMEGITTILDFAEIEGKIIGIGKKGSRVNHILFADGIMLFSKAQPHCIEALCFEKIRDSIWS